MSSRRVPSAILLLVALPACNEVFGFREGHLTSGEPPAPCTTVADCKVDVPECRKAVSCKEGACVFEDAIEGTVLAKQTPSDCKEIICDGEGSTKLVVATMDIEDDSNECTVDTCNGPVPVHTPTANVACYTGPVDTEGVGICHAGVRCSREGNPLGACVGEVTPAVEDCDVEDHDEDCDGQVNEDGASCTCGDGIISAGIGETCDDGNTVATDACTSECSVATCGDGHVRSGFEECDDGNQLSGDSCDASCQSEVVVTLALGELHGCALLHDGRLKCWGYNAYGQLGLGDTNDLGDDPAEMGDMLPAVDLGDGASVVMLTAGAGHTCALLGNGSVKCWGLNNLGQLGLEDGKNRGDQPGEMGNVLPAVNLGAGKSAIMVATGANHTCAVLNDGSVKCWGYNTVGQLGLGDMSSRGDQPGEMGDSLTAVDLGTGQIAVAVTAGSSHSCALLAGGFVKCWGANVSGQLGLGDTQSRGAALGQMGDALPMVNLGTGRTATAVAAGYGFTCALLDDATVKCWGGNGEGQLGLGDTASRGKVPSELGDVLPTVDLGTGGTPVAMSVGSQHSCTLLTEGRVKCWGRNDEGQLGLGDVLNRGDDPAEMGDVLPTVSLPTSRIAKAVAARGAHVCVILDNGSVRCWGRGSFGELGLGDTTNHGDQPGEMGDALPQVHFYGDQW